MPITQAVPETDRLLGSRPQAHSHVGAGLLAKAVCQAINALTDTPSSRASPLPQLICVHSFFCCLLIEIPPRARRHFAPRPAFAAAPPVRLPRSGRRPARPVAPRHAPAGTVRPTGDDRYSGGSHRHQRSAGRETQAGPGPARRYATAAARAVQAVPVDVPVLPAQPRRHFELGAAGFAAPG
ncbi:hypothetical protein D3C80_756910 [compost metagenome]